MADLKDWNGVPEPQRITLEGRYARLEPLDSARHASDLWELFTAPGSEVRLRYLSDMPPKDRAEFRNWLTKGAASQDPLFFVVIDRNTGRVGGRQALMRIVPAHGVVEVGHVLWGPLVARTRVATEALYLFAQYVFEQLGYRRFEWKCNNHNEPSKRAAARFGFRYEGLFRNHMVVKGESRDTAWFAMTDTEWPELKAAFQSWLSPDNFDTAGLQKRKLITVPAM